MKKFDVNKIIDWFKKNKANIIILLTGLSALVASIATMDGVDKTIWGLISVLITTAIMILKQGFTEQTLNLIATAIKIIIEQLQKKDVKPETVAKAVGVELSDDLSVDDIKDQLIDGLMKLNKAE